MNVNEDVVVLVVLALVSTFLIAVAVYLPLLLYP